MVIWPAGYLFFAESDVFEFAESTAFHCPRWLVFSGMRYMILPAHTGRPTVTATQQVAGVFSFLADAVFTNFHTQVLSIFLEWLRLTLLHER